MRRTAVRGSALTDVLIVAGIVAALIALFYPVFQQARQSPKFVECSSRGQMLGRALVMYVEDYDRRLPPLASVVGGKREALPSLLYPYLKNATTWACPEASQQFEYDLKPGDTSVSYGYNGLALVKNGVGIQLSAVKTDAWTVAFAESTSYFAAPAPLASGAGATPPVYPHRERGTIVWVDGHAKLYPQPEVECAPGTEHGKPLGAGIDAYDQWNLR